MIRIKRGVFFHHVAQAAIQHEITVDEMLDEANEFGFDYVELSEEDCHTPACSPQNLKRHGFSVSNINYFYPWDKSPYEMKAFDQIAMAREYGLDKLMIIPGFYSGNEKSEAAELQNMLSGAKRFAEEALKHGITPMIECFDNALSPISTTAGMTVFLNEIPEMKVVLDTGNHFFSGEDPINAVNAFGERIAHVHAKDRSISDNSNKPVIDMIGRSLYPCAVGDGVVPIRDVAHKLFALGYDGIFAAEFYNVKDYGAAVEISGSFLSAI